MKFHYRSMFRLAIVLLLVMVFLPTVLAHPEGETDDGGDENPNYEEPHHTRDDAKAGLIEQDALHEIPEGGGGSIIHSEINNMTLLGRGYRTELNATTDVWAHEGFAYTGTFNTPCGGSGGAGVWVWDVRGIQDGTTSVATFAGVIASPDGSRANDVRVAEMNSGDVLVMSNEPCDGGPGGFEVYNVNDPYDPQHIASVTTDDINPYLAGGSVGVNDVGVHNLFLFTQGNKDYVTATTEGWFGNFQIWELTQPQTPRLVGWWGAEELAGITEPGGVGPADFKTNANSSIVNAGQLFLLDGYGQSSNLFLHDVTVSADGTRAYLSNWDAGLVLLDISDVTDPQVISVAIDPTSEDGEVNSHSAWPSEDGSIVIEGEEDFDAFELNFIIEGLEGNDYAVSEGSVGRPIAALSEAELANLVDAEIRYVGYACEGSEFAPGAPFEDPVPVDETPEFTIALVQRGGCYFSDKVYNAEAAGYDGMIVFSDPARATELISMGAGGGAGSPGGANYVSEDLVNFFVRHQVGLDIMGVASASDLVVGEYGNDVTFEFTPNGWSGFRIWDYSNPEDPILASTYNTFCSEFVVGEECDPLGTYSSHNVIVETVADEHDDHDGHVYAYISWYWDGVVVLDITDPYDVFEVAVYNPHTDPEFVEQNGGPQDVWGIYKIPGEPEIYASDRNGGLYVLEIGEEVVEPEEEFAEVDVQIGSMYCVQPKTNEIMVVVNVVDSEFQPVENVIVDATFVDTPDRRNSGATGYVYEDVSAVTNNLGSVTFLLNNYKNKGLNGFYVTNLSGTDGSTTFNYVFSPAADVVLIFPPLGSCN